MATSTVLPDGFAHVAVRPEGSVVVSAAAPRRHAAMAPDVLLVDADQPSLVDAAWATLESGPTPSAVGVLGSDARVVSSLVNEFRAIVPSEDLLDLLVRAPASALWMMRRPRPSLDVIGAALAILCGASEVRLVGHPTLQESDTRLVSACHSSGCPEVRTELDWQFLSDVQMLSSSEVALESTPHFDLPAAKVSGRLMAAVVHVEGRADVACVVAEQVRLTSDLPTVALAGTDADRATLRAHGLAVVDLPRLAHDGKNRLGPLWALALAPLDRVIFLHDVVVHSDLRPLLAGDDFWATTRRRAGAVAVPDARVFVASPSTRLASHIAQQFVTPGFHHRGLGQELADIFLDWKGLRATAVGHDSEVVDSIMTRFGAVKPWHLAAPRPSRPADDLWFETAASIGVTGGRDPVRLLRAVRALAQEGSYRAAASALTSSRPMGRSRVAKEVVRQARNGAWKLRK